MDNENCNASKPFVCSNGESFVRSGIYFAELSFAGLYLMN